MTAGRLWWLIEASSQHTLHLCANVYVEQGPSASSKTLFVCFLVTNEAFLHTSKLVIYDEFTL